MYCFVDHSLKPKECADMNKHSLVPLKASRDSQTSSARLKRKCACENNGATCARCASQQQQIERKAITSGDPDFIPPIINDVLISSGHPLDTVTRAFMEARFHHDFSDVRIHINSFADKAVKAVNAAAFTVGRNIAFREQLYAPETENGRLLIAHELAHTIQQRSAAVPGNRGLLSSRPSDKSEDEATLAATRVVANQRSSSLSQTGLILHRGFGDDKRPERPTRLTPEEMLRRVLEQRGWTNRAAQPVLPPGARGPDLGHGVDTHAFLQVTDKEGRVVAHEMGGHLTSDKSIEQSARRDLPRTPREKGKVHAERMALERLRVRLKDIDVQGGVLEVAVDQIPCDISRKDCMGHLHEYAREKGLELRLYVPQDDAGVSPKGAARRAFRDPAQSDTQGTGGARVRRIWPAEQTLGTEGQGSTKASDNTPPVLNSNEETRFRVEEQKPKVRFEESPIPVEEPPPSRQLRVYGDEVRTVEEILEIEEQALAYESHEGSGKQQVRRTAPSDANSTRQTTPHSETLKTGSTPSASNRATGPIAQQAMGSKKVESPKLEPTKPEVDKANQPKTEPTKAPPIESAPTKPSSDSGRIEATPTGSRTPTGRTPASGLGARAIASGARTVTFVAGEAGMWIRGFFSPQNLALMIVDMAIEYWIESRERKFAQDAITKKMSGNDIQNQIVDLVTKERNAIARGQFRGQDSYVNVHFRIPTVNKQVQDVQFSRLSRSDSQQQNWSCTVMSHGMPFFGTMSENQVCYVTVSVRVPPLKLGHAEETQYRIEQLEDLERDAALQSTDSAESARRSEAIKRLREQLPKAEKEDERATAEEERKKIEEIGRSSVIADQKRRDEQQREIAERLKRNAPPAKDTGASKPAQVLPPAPSSSSSFLFSPVPPPLVTLPGAPTGENTQKIQERAKSVVDIFARQAEWLEQRGTMLRRGASEADRKTFVDQEIKWHLRAKMQLNAFHGNTYVTKAYDQLGGLLDVAGAKLRNIRIALGGPAEP